MKIINEDHKLRFTQMKIRFKQQIDQHIQNHKIGFRTTKRDQVKTKNRRKKNKQNNRHTHLIKTDTLNQSASERERPLRQLCVCDNR